MDLPFKGVLHSAATKQFQETVVFLPFYGAHQNNLKRHVELVNELGYDCVSFDLKDHWSDMSPSVFKTGMKWGFKNIWADQLKDILDSIDGKKIIFSFSNSCGSAFEATVKRHWRDISGIICDSGPSGELWKSIFNYMTFEAKLPTLPLKVAMTTALTALWHPGFEAAIHKDLAKFPQGFRLLSIRGWKDKLISPKMIDSIFEPHKNLDWQKLSLPDAGHLNGLKDFRNEYVPALTKFLGSVSTSLT